MFLTANRTWIVVGVLALLIPSGLARADEPAKPADEPKSPSREELIKNLAKTLSGAKLTGRFTVKGKEDMAPALKSTPSPAPAS